MEHLQPQHEALLSSYHERLDHVHKQLVDGLDLLHGQLDIASEHSSFNHAAEMNQLRENIDSVPNRLASHNFRTTGRLRAFESTDAEISQRVDLLEAIQLNHHGNAI